MAWDEPGRFTVIMGKGQPVVLLDTLWGQAWRLYGGKWVAIPHSGDVVPAQRPPEMIPENFVAGKSAEQEEQMN